MTVLPNAEQFAVLALKMSPPAHMILRFLGMIRATAKRLFGFQAIYPLIYSRYYTLNILVQQANPSSDKDFQIIQCYIHTLNNCRHFSHVLVRTEVEDLQFYCMFLLKLILVYYCAFPL